MPMIDGLARELETAKLRWMSGGNAEAASLPLTEGCAPREAQLRLLAVASQFRQICILPEVPGDLRTGSSLPQFEHPLLAEALRPQFRRLIARSRERTWSENLIGLMAARGVLAHPFDWMPPSDTTGYPDAYQHLARWIAREHPDEPVSLRTENFDDLMPVERRTMVRDMRKANPNAARDLLIEKAQKLAAEERLRLVELMAVGLSDDDIAFLQKLAESDRSGKIKALALRLLSRLGIAMETDAAHELAGFMEIAKRGILSRKPVIRFRSKLNDVQKRRIQAELGNASIPTLAAALNVNAGEFLERWRPMGHRHVELMLAACAGSARDEDLLAYWSRLKTESAADFNGLQVIAPRMSRAALLTEVSALVKAGVLKSPDEVLQVTGPDLPPEQGEELLQAETVRNMTIDSDLDALGCLLPAEQAARLHEKFINQGAHSADPALDLLRFNASLKGHPY